MKKKLFVLLSYLCCLNMVYAQNYINEYNKTSNLPFLNKDRMISINQDDSKYLRKTNNKYVELIEKVISAKNDKDLSKANKKAVTFFEDLLSSSNSIDENILACYQLGHYYAFGIFDPYFDGSIPSNIERKGLLPIDKSLAKTYLDKIPSGFQSPKGLIQLIPDTWCFNIEEGLASVPNLSYKELEKVLKFLDDNRYNFNPQRVCRKSHDFCDYCDTKSIYSLDIIKLLYGIDKLPTTSPIRKQLSLDLNSDEIAALALSYDKQFKRFEALFYGGLAAIRGNANGYLIFLENWTKSFINHFKSNHDEEYTAGLAHRIIPLRLWSIEDCLNDCNIKNFEQLSDAIETYYEDLADDLYAEYEADQKAKKRARRREIWGQIGMALVGALQQTSAQMSNYYSSHSYNQMNNLNNLLDPQLATMQVNAQYYAEYQNFCTYNKKNNGDNYSFSEWLAIRGQLMQNSNNNPIGDHESNPTSQLKGNSSSSNSTTADCPSLKVNNGNWYCANTGKCGMCNGTGSVSDGFGQSTKHKCTLCNGSGKCKYCSK